MKFSPSENQIRLTAFFVFLLVIIFGATNWLPIPVFLFIDFGLRGFGYGKFSPIAMLSSSIVHRFNLAFKPIFFPPKQFAAKIGFLFSFLFILFHFFEIETLPLILVLLLCSGLEAFANYCVGCQAFNLLQKFRKNA